VKNYVSEILKENDGSLGIDNGGMGGSWGTKGDLYNAFVKPFADVIGVAAGKTKELARKGITLVQVAFETVATTLIPFLKDSYDEIFAAEKADIAKIQNEYKDVYDATKNAFKNDSAIVAFLAYPGAALTGKIVKDSPKIASGLLSLVTGGLSDKYLGGEGSSKKSDGPRGSNIFDSYARSYQKLILEKDDDKEENALADAIGGKKFINAVINKSPNASMIAKEAQKIYKTTLEKAFKQASEVINAKSIEELEKIVGKKLKGTEKLKDVKPEERQTAEKELLEGLKKSIKELYTSGLKAQIQNALKGGIPEDSQYIVDYRFVIQKIESL
jgi:hypothetical protein